MNRLDVIQQEDCESLWKSTLREQYESLQEMATLRKDSSLLPVNLYLDDSMSYTGGKHGKRIKFQRDYGPKPITRNFPSMKLDGNLIGVKPKTLDSKDIKQIQNFVLNNREALEQLADMNIGIDEFKKIMIPGGKTADEPTRRRMLGALQALLSS